MSASVDRRDNTPPAAVGGRPAAVPPVGPAATAAATTRRGVVLRVLPLAAGAPLLAACGAQPGAPGAAPAAGGPPVTVSFFWRADPGPYFDQAAEKAKIFTERFAAYRAEVAYQAGTYTEKVTAMFAAGDPPATFWTDHSLILPYRKQGYLEDLTPFAKSDRGYKASDYPPASTDSLTVGGKLYGLSGASFTAGWFYNRALYDKAGIPAPGELQKRGKWAWDPFLAGAKRITAAGGGTVLGLGSGIPGIRLWLNSNGVQEVDDLKFPTRSFYDDARAVRAVEHWADLFLSQKGRDPAFGAGTSGGETTLLMGGKLGAMSRWTTGLSGFLKLKDFAWGMAPFPKGPRGKTPAGEFTFWGFAMARGLKDERRKRGAWEWLKFYNGTDGQMIEGARYLLSIPYDKAAMEGWRKRVATTTMEYPELIFEVRDKYPNQRIMAADGTDINRLHDQALAPVWTGQRSPREACTEAARQVNEYLKQNPQKAS